MISASESLPSAAADACGVVAAISMPRSSAAVLTLVSTPWWPESFAFCPSGEVVKVPSGEGDRGVREGFGSGAIQKGRTGQGAVRIQTRIRPCRRLGYHARPPHRNPFVPCQEARFQKICKASIDTVTWGSSLMG